MRVKLGTININARARRAIRSDLGLSGLATGQEIRDFFLNHADSVLVDKIATLVEQEPKWEGK